MSNQQITGSETVATPVTTPTSLCGRKLSYPAEIDEQLVRWVRSEQLKGVILSPDILRKEALHLIQPYCYEFKASTGWLDKFLTRHKLSLQSINHKASKVLSSTLAEKKVMQDAICAATTTTTITKSAAMPVSIKQQAPSTLLGDNPDDDDDDDEEEENENKKDELSSPEKPINPERLKAFNMFVRLFIDENLDRLVPISKQPKEKINAIIMSCQRQFPEFSDRARKRIRTYLKSCRRSTRLREPSSRPSMSHIPATQLTEVNNILANACQSESHEVAKRQRLDSTGKSVVTALHNVTASGLPLLNDIAKTSLGSGPIDSADISVFQSFISSKIKQPVLKLSQAEVTSVRNLITGYRQSASFLQRSANELERVLSQCEAYTDEGVKLDDVVKNPLPNGNEKGLSNQQSPPQTAATKPAVASCLPTLITPTPPPVRSSLTKSQSLITLPMFTQPATTQGLIVDSLLKSKVEAMKEKLVVQPPSFEYGSMSQVTSVISPNASIVQKPADQEKICKETTNTTSNSQKNGHPNSEMDHSKDVNNVNHLNSHEEQVSTKDIKTEEVEENRNCKKEESFNTLTSEPESNHAIISSKLKNEINLREQSSPILKLQQLFSQQHGEGQRLHEEEHGQVPPSATSGHHTQQQLGEQHGYLEQHRHAQLAAHHGATHQGGEPHRSHSLYESTDEQRPSHQGGESHSQQQQEHHVQLHSDRQHTDDFHSRVEHMTHEPSYRHNSKPVISPPMSLEQLHSQVYSSYSSQQHTSSMHNVSSLSNLYQQSKQMHKHNSPLQPVSFNLSHVSDHLSPRQHVSHTPPLQLANHQPQHVNHITSHITGEHLSQHQSHSEQLNEHSSHTISYTQQFYNTGRHGHQTSRLSPMSQQQQQQGRGIHSANYHHQTTPSGHHHQNVFNFDSVNNQLLDSPHQQYLHQRLSPHPGTYHPSILSPASSPHVQELSRQSHLQEISRQSHIQELNRQQIIPDMTRQQSHSEYSNLPHNIQFDMHQSH